MPALLSSLSSTASMNHISICSSSPYYSYTHDSRVSIDEEPFAKLPLEADDLRWKLVEIMTVLHA